MDNFIGNGRSLQINVPPATIYLGGQLLNVGHIVGIVAADGAEGEQVSLIIEGIFEVPKNVGEEYFQGDPLYSAAGQVTSTPEGVKFAGYAAKDAQAADTTCYLLLSRDRENFEVTPG